jgi:hypothetical protein
MTNSALCWTDEEEKLFAELRQIGCLTRIQAIHLYKRSKSNSNKALKIAQDNYAMTDEERAGYARSKDARVAGLAKARAARAKRAEAASRNSVLNSTNAALEGVVAA